MQFRNNVAYSIVFNSWEYRLKLIMMIERPETTFAVDDV